MTSEAAGAPDRAQLMAQMMALIGAARQGDIAGATALLDAQPALAGMADADGQTPMQAAIYGNQPEMVALLRQRGVVPSLFEAAALGDIAALQAAITAYPQGVREYSFDGWTALHLAAHFGRVEAARVLLGANSNVSAHSWNGLDNEPIHAAAAHPGNVEMVALLLDAGAQVNAREHGGFTPLHQAAQNGDVQMVELLLSRGARRSLETDKEQTAYDLAFAAGHHDLANRLS
jgi:uncharacterized protein